MARVVVVLACLLACQAALSTAQNADKASKHISNAIQGPSVAVDAVPARQKDAAAPAVQPVKGPQLATKNKTAGPAAEVLEVESMISGDVIEDSSSTAPDVKSMGGSSTAVGPTARRKAAAIQTASAVDKISSKLPPVTVSISSKKQAPSSSKQEGKSSKHKASLKAQKGEEGEEEEQQPEGESDDNKSGSSSSSDHDAGNDAADSDAGSGSSSGVSHKAVKGKKGKHKQVADCPLWPPSAQDQGLTSPDRPAALSIFSELTVDEYNAVLNFLYSQEHLNLIDIISSDPDKTLTVANYIHSIYLEPAPKAEVLQYLDHHGPKPARKARATLVLGLADPPVVREVLVTLHDEGSAITVDSLEKVNIHSSKLKTIPYAQRPQSQLDENGVIAALAEVEDTLNGVFEHAFSGFTYGDDCGDKCIDWTITYAQTFQDQGVPRAAYVQFYWYTDEARDGNYLHTVPVEALVGASDERLENWAIVRLWFAGQFFDSAKDLLHAWQHDVKGLQSKFKFDMPNEEESLFATFQKRPGHRRGVDHPVGPLPWEPYGRRFTITHGNKVEWLGWSLYVGYVPSYGGRLWDIRFKGERMAYELSLQEAMAVYGGADLTQANTVFLDSSFGMGYNLRELAQGIDCPMNAAYMDAVVFYGGMSGPTTYHNAICVFEHSPNMPLLRHYSSAYKFYGAVPGAQLVVRMISTVYNYDYIQDLHLGVDGTLDVKVTTSGYIQATTFRTFYPQHYAFPISNNVSGSVHTHVLAWKVDLDIAGTHNSLNMLNFKTAKADNGLGGEVYINKYDAHIVEKEDDSGYISKMFEPKMPIIINENKRNKWGSPRGYKVQLNRPLANLEPKGYPRSAGLGFWKWNFVATQRNEDETHSSSTYTQSDIASPPNSLTDYVDGDSIRRKDLVVWVNSGLYHVPMAEDAPVTPASGHNQLGFSLIPYNWADENAATDMADMFTIDKETANSTVPVVKKVLHKCKPNYVKLPFSTTGFEGTTSTDEAVAELATVTIEVEDADSGPDDNVGSSGSRAGGQSKKGGKRRRKRHGTARMGAYKDTVTSVMPSQSSLDIPTATSAGVPAQASRRVCRHSKRWSAC